MYDLACLSTPLAGFHVYMNATLHGVESQRDSVSEKGPQASANSSFTNNLERAIMVLKVLGLPKYHTYSHPGPIHSHEKLQ